MQKEVKQLAGRQFYIYEMGEYAGSTGFMGFMRILGKYSDVLDHYTTKEQTRYLQKLLKYKWAHVGALIDIKISEK